MARRHVLHVSEELGAREALAHACRVHLDEGRPACELQVALVPGVDAWHDASSFLAWAAAKDSAVAGASAEATAALAHRLVSAAPLDAWLELSWRAPPGGAEELEGLAPYGAWTQAAERGLSCHVTIVSDGSPGPSAAAPAPTAAAHWRRLLRASHLQLPLDDGLLALRALFERPRHWRGGVHFVEWGKVLDGVRLCPYLENGAGPSADATEAPPAGARPQPRRSLPQPPLDARLPRSTCGGSPAAGATLRALRLLRASQMPAHLRLPHKWSVLGTPGEESERFLEQWARCGPDAPDAVLVRVEPPAAAAAAPAPRARRAGANARRPQPPPLAQSGAGGTLLLFCHEGRVLAQLCAEPHGLVAALLYLEQGGEAPPVPTAARTPDADADAGASWLRRAPSSRASSVGSGSSRGSGSPSRPRKRRQPPGLDGAVGEAAAAADEPPRRVKPKAAPAEVGQEWAERLRSSGNLDRAKGLRDALRGLRARDKWGQAERRALQQLRFVAPAPSAAGLLAVERAAREAAGAVPPPAASALHGSALSRAPTLDRSAIAPPSPADAPPEIDAAAEPAPTPQDASPAAAERARAAPEGAAGGEGAAAAEQVAPTPAARDTPQPPADASALPGPTHPGSAASSASRGSRSSRHSGGSERAHGLRPPLPQPPRPRSAADAAGVAAKAAARPLQPNAAGGRARGHLMLTATTGGGGGGGGGGGSGGERGTAPARAGGSGGEGAAEGGAPEGPAAGAAVTIDDVVRACAHLAPDGGAWPVDQPLFAGGFDGLPALPGHEDDGGAREAAPAEEGCCAPWALGLPYEGAEQQAALNGLLPAPEAEYESLLCASLPSVLPHARVGRRRTDLRGAAAAGAGAAASSAAAGSGSGAGSGVGAGAGADAGAGAGAGAGVGVGVGAGAGAGESVGAGAGAGAGAAAVAADPEGGELALAHAPSGSARKDNTALVKRHAKRMLHNAATSCELFGCRAATAEDFLRDEVAQVVRLALRELQRTCDLDSDVVSESEAKAGVAEAFCTLMQAGAAALAKLAERPARPVPNRG